MKWFAKYCSWGDFTGGLMAAVIALPLCLAFGVASGLGAASGLYGAIACGIFAALFGGTPAQCSGPTGPMTVVAAATFAANREHPGLVFAAIIAAGILQIVMGYFKTGQLVHYLPYPVISGFMTGIGAIIVCIQVGPFFGLPGSGGVLESLQGFVGIVSKCNQEALLLGSVTLGCIYLLPLVARSLPASLIAIVVATWLSCALNMNVPRIGEIPSRFPLPHLPQFHFTDLHLVLQAGITLAILGAIDSLLTSLVLDKVTGGRHSSNRELIGQGLGNIVAGFLGGLPGAGATMRSMVNVKAGGRSKFSGAFHGLVLLAVLLGLSKIASQIPLAALAATLISVGFNIMDWRVLKRLRVLPKSDVMVMLVVLLLTIFVDLIVAVLVGVALASMLFVKQLSDAKTSSAGDVNTLEELRQIAEHIPEAVRKSIYTYQFNGPLFFGEAKNLGAIVDALSEAKYIMLRFHSVPLIDQTGAYALEDAIEKWEARGIKIMFIGLEGHIRRALEATGGATKIREEFCFEQFEDALEAIDIMEAGESKSTFLLDPARENKLE